MHAHAGNQEFIFQGSSSSLSRPRQVRTKCSLFGTQCRPRAPFSALGAENVCHHCYRDLILISIWVGNYLRIIDLLARLGVQKPTWKKALANYFPNFARKTAWRTITKYWSQFHGLQHYIKTLATSGFPSCLPNTIPLLKMSHQTFPKFS